MGTHGVALVAPLVNMCSSSSGSVNSGNCAPPSDYAMGTSPEVSVYLLILDDISIYFVLNSDGSNDSVLFSVAFLSGANVS